MEVSALSDDLYLLTGGTGLLGGNLVRELVARGLTTRLLVLPNDKAIASLPKGVEVVQGDLLDKAALEQFFSAPPETQLMVIHAASIVTVDPEPNEKVRLVNVEGTRNIIDQCIAHHAQRLVYVSSTSAIPELPLGQPIQETEQFDPSLVTGYYAQTKALASQLVIQAAKEKDLDASIVFPSVIFGPNDYGFGMITSCVQMVAEGKLPISIGGTFNSVDARDLAAGIIACVQKGRKGRSYIMASRLYTFDDLITSICHEAGTRAPRLSVPLRFIKPFAGFGSLYAKITHKPAWFSRFTLYNLERNNDYAATRAQTELGFSCRPLDESIADTISWLKQIGRLA